MTTKSAVGAGQEVDADEVAFHCGGGANRQLAGLARRLDRLADSAECDVRPPFARRRDPPDRAHHGAARNDDPDVVAPRRNELLHECAVACEPGAVDHRSQVTPERSGVLAEDDVHAPASEPRLDDHGRFERNAVGRRRHMRGARVRDICVAQRPARGELVVRGHERAGPVQDPDAGALESRQLPEAGLDPVQPLGDIEAADRNVSLAERAGRGCRLEDAQARTGKGERHVRAGAMVGDDRDLHGA